MAKLDTLIAQDVTALHQKKPCKDPNEVSLYNLNTWIRDRPKELVSHLQKICNLDNSPASQYQLARLIEQIYKSQNSRLVLPLAFREGLITYKMSNSSLLSGLNSKSKSSGSHTFITSWLNKSAECPINFPPGVVRVVFDNEQVIGKRYRVKANQFSVTSSFISCSSYVSIDKTNDIQYSNDFKPANWMFKPIRETLLESIFDSFEQYNDLFQQTRNQLLSERLALIIGSQETIGRLVEEKKEQLILKCVLHINKKLHSARGHADYARQN